MSGVLGLMTSKKSVSNGRVFCEGMTVTLRHEVDSKPYATRTIVKVKAKTKHIEFVEGPPSEMRRGDLILFEGFL